MAAHLERLAPLRGLRALAPPALVAAADAAALCDVAIVCPTGAGYTGRSPAACHHYVAGPEVRSLVWFADAPAAGEDLVTVLLQGGPPAAARAAIEGGAVPICDGGIVCLAV